MTREEFYRWFHEKYLYAILRHTCDDSRYYRDMVIEVLNFMNQIGNCYSWLNYACILAAWANEHFLCPLSTFADRLEKLSKDYWDTHPDNMGLCPVPGVDYDL